MIDIIKPRFFDIQPTPTGSFQRQSTHSNPFYELGGTSDRRARIQASIGNGKLTFVQKESKLSHGTNLGD